MIKYIANFKNGVIREGANIGFGKVLGNIKNGVIRSGTNSMAGFGTVVGNVKNDVIREGSNSMAGFGKVIGKNHKFYVPAYILFMRPPLYFFSNGIIKS